MKNFKKIFNAYILLFSCFCFAQNENMLSRHTEVNEFVSELYNRQIDTICDYEVFTKKTEAKYTQYIFWKEKGKTKLKKLETGKLYPIIDVSIEEIWHYFFSNLKTMKNEEIKSFAFMENNELIDVASQANEIKEFNLFLNGYILKCWTESTFFQKTEKIGSQNVTNVNFEYNKNTKLKSMIDKLNEAVKNLEKLKAFK